MAGRPGRVNPGILPGMLYIDGVFEDRPLAARAEVDRAIAAATRVARELAAWPAHRRAALCDATAYELRARSAAMAELICREAKKPMMYATAEVERAIATFTFAADEARRLSGEVVRLDAAPGGEGRLGVALRVPRGPVAAITPFNFPLNLVAHKVAPALACGAPVVLKPAPETPGTAIALARILHEAGAPPGALSVVPCALEDAALLVEDDRLRVLSFTGSAKVGWELKARAGEKHVLLELGGNAACILLPDADLAAALPRIVAGAYAYAGQVCIKLQRLVVHEAIYDQVAGALPAAVEQRAVVGDPARSDVVVGPLIRTRDADRVEAWVAEAGGEVLLGGRREGDTVWPVVLAGVDPAAKVLREEVFGPVLVLERARDLDDAIARVNDSPYGLQAGIYTRDHASLMKAFRELAVGAVLHDDVPIYRADHMPYGGTKRSGIGREGPRYAIEEMTEPRLLVMRA
jgi:acyl-CoA reductase-like NAD-dependent aldehyde dehydrogenase